MAPEEGWELLQMMVIWGKDRNANRRVSEIEDDLDALLNQRLTIADERKLQNRYAASGETVDFPLLSRSPSDKRPTRAIFAHFGGSSEGHQWLPLHLVGEGFLGASSP